MSVPLEFEIGVMAEPFTSYDPSSQATHCHNCQVPLIRRD